MSQEPATSTEPLFRASKRRRVAYKRRQDEDGSDREPRLQTPAHLNDGTAKIETETDGDGDDTQRRLSLPQRKPIASKRGGIAFSTSAAQRRAANDNEDVDNNDQHVNDSRALAPPQNATEAAINRFMAPTGQVMTSDDRHMMAYIDSKLASIRAKDTATSSTLEAQSTRPRDRYESSSEPSEAQTPDDHNSADPQPSTSSASAAAADAKPTISIQPRPKPPRLGRDGKPLRPRKDRNRRTSFDINRDAMVDQVLAESRLEIYARQPQRRPMYKPTEPTGLNEAADERMAAEYKRNFINALEDRRARRALQAPPPSKKTGPAKESRGPKLGGSRAQRAAMRASLREAKAKKEE